MSESTLRQAVEIQARARVSGDATGFASYFTPRALTQMRTMPPSRPRGFDVMAIIATGTTGSSDVLYRGRDAHVLAQRWQIVDGVWTAVDVEWLPAPRHSLWSRLAAFIRRQPRVEGDDGDEDAAA